MASTNFDDNTRKRFTGGRFGVGAKATNAWSDWFRVRTLHAASGLEYEQTWSENMVKKTKAVVKQQKKGKKGWTEIRWLPDYKRFGLDGLDEDTRACMEMRVYDLCACTKESIKVSLNGRVLPVRHGQTRTDTDAQTHTQTDRQTHTHTHTQTHKHTNTHTHTETDAAGLGA
eukprot:3420533-Rhodomonas_salina.2